MNQPGKKPKSPSLTTMNQIMDTVWGHGTPVEVETTQKSSLMERLGISQGWEFSLMLAISKAPSLWFFSLAQ